MMNLKGLFISGSLSILFGMYSMYNILDYIRRLDLYYNDEVYNLKQALIKTNKKLNETNMKYKSLLTNIEKIQNETLVLLTDVTYLKNITDNMKQNDYEINYSKDNDIRDKENTTILMDPKINIDLINSLINLDELAINRIEYQRDEENEFEFLEKNNIESSGTLIRKRALSITDVDWIGSAKKMLSFYF